MLLRLQAALAAAAILMPSWSVHAAQPPVMASYRAVYELSLANGSGERGVESARGRIVMEFMGTPCEGYTLSLRQVTDIAGGDIGRKVSDMRSTTYEDGEGKSFRFKTETRMGSGPNETVDGSAERTGSKVTVSLRKPKTEKITLEGDVAFPTQHMKELVEQARAGNRTFARKVYDGSDDSKDAYDTFAVIGAEKKGGIALEPDVLKAGWEKMPRWPVSISFFEAGETDKPAYIISYELFENGFGRALKLDYGSFGFDGKLSKLEMIETKACK